MKSYLFFGLLLLQLSVFGQLTDTLIVLDEVSIVSSKEKYLAGSKIKSIDSLHLNSNAGSNIHELISRFLPIYIKQDAGGIAMIRFRGTSPEHTAILFNGININSYTLGLSNLASLPAFLFDEIKVQYGSSSSLYGSDAIGGSIHLNNNPEWNKGMNLALQQDISSFNSGFTGIKSGFSNNRFQFSLKAYRQKSKNNFTFLNTAVKDFEKDLFVKDTSRNAAYRNFGILQDINYKMSGKSFSYVRLWYSNNWYQVQPNMSANYYGGDFAEILEKHLRAIAGIKYYTGSHTITADAGYIYDYQLYNKNSEQIISTRSYLLNLNYYNKKIFGGDLNTGANYSLIHPDVYAYEKNPEESRIDIFLLYKKSFINRLEASVNLRQSLVSNYKSQFTPSIGFDYHLIENEGESLNVKYAASRSYKIPTFNVRFWYPNGNPDIRPETGMNYEISTDYEIIRNSTSLKISAGGYLMNVDNLIQWINLDLWRPENLKKVRSSGIEINAEAGATISEFILTSGINYSYNKATEIKSYNSSSASAGKQLIYTPEHLGNAYFSLSFRNWRLMTNASYTGRRYTENYSFLKDYFLLNSSLGRSILLKRNILFIDFKINNILNHAYQNQEYYAMPGRNCSISLKYSLNNLKSKNYETN